jgi:hypothetical protein
VFFILGVCVVLALNIPRIQSGFVTLNKQDNATAITVLEMPASDGTGNDGGLPAFAPEEAKRGY